MVSRPLIAQGYSLAEEIANSISHGIGLVFGIVGLVLLLVQAVDANASAMAITSYSLYGGSMILLFLASTLYHAIPHQRAKMWLKKFDHCAIYLLIAGTYTPFLLVGLNSPLCSVWRCRLESETVSKSSRVSCPTPAAARYCAAAQPSPPRPTTSTRAAFNRSWPSKSKPRKTICRL